MNSKAKGKGQKAKGKVKSFQVRILEHWKKHGRHYLPWRKTNDPYRILVSEVMLQQTQVDRVIPKYEEFLKSFPTVHALAKAPLADVLKIWNGLGYNRRAKFLRDAAIVIIEKCGGKVPRDYESLRALPGVGDYTARAVRVFAWNEPDILIETNIRTALIHTFFSGVTPVTDLELMTLLSKVIDTREPRKFYWALMDYGAYLKRSGVRNNQHSAHYVKHSKFEGSLRQLRGEILRALSRHEDISGLRNPNFRKFSEAVHSLARDGLIVAEGKKWRIA